jgi:hypothetical protein
MEQAIIQYGAVAILFLIAIKEFFAYLKARNDAKKSDNNGEILKELKLINMNHLQCIESAVRDGDDRIVKAINDGNQKMVEILGEIRGKLK